MRWLAIVLCVFVVGCGAFPKEELPSSTEGEGSDAMRISPCACDFEDFTPHLYEWRDS